VPPLLAPLLPLGFLRLSTGALSFRLLSSQNRWRISPEQPGFHMLIIFLFPSADSFRTNLIMVAFLCWPTPPPRKRLSGHRVSFVPSKRRQFSETFLIGFLDPAVTKSSSLLHFLTAGRSLSMRYRLPTAAFLFHKPANFRRFCGICGDRIFSSSNRSGLR